MTYFAGLLGWITAEALCNKVIMFGSVALIAARLCYEVPKAIGAIRKWFK